MGITAEIMAEMAKKKISIKEMAELTGISRTTLSMRLNEHSSFDLDELNVVCEHLGVEGWELMRRATQEKVSA